jgi:hypothetical protein
MAREVLGPEPKPNILKAFGGWRKIEIQVLKKNPGHSPV